MSVILPQNNQITQVQTDKNPHIESKPCRIGIVSQKEYQEQVRLDVDTRRKDTGVTDVRTHRDVSFATAHDCIAGDESHEMGASPEAGADA